MKAFTYRIDTTKIEFEAEDFPGQKDRKVDFDRAKNMRSLAAAHNGQGLSSDEMALTLEIRRKLSDAVKAKRKELVLIPEESVFLKGRLPFMLWAIPHAEFDEFCRSIREPKEVAAEVVKKR